MNAINTEYDFVTKFKKEQAPASLKAGDIIWGTLSAIEDDKAIINLDGGKTIQTPVENIVGEIGQRLDFKVVDVNNNSVVMKQIIEEKAEPEYHKESTELTGEELLNWTKGAVIPITGEVFKNSIIRLEANAEQDRRMLDALSQIKKDIKYSINNVNASAVSLLASNGISVNNVTMTMLSQAVKSSVKGVSPEPSPEEVTAAIEGFAKHDNSILYKQTLNSVKALLTEDLPITDTNVSQMNSVQQSLSEISGMKQEDKLNFLLMEKDATVEGLLTAIHSGNAQPAASPMDDGTWKDMLNSVSNYMERENIPKTQENIDTAKLLIENDIPVTRRNLEFINNSLEAAPDSKILAEAASFLAKGESVFKAAVFQYEAAPEIDQALLLDNYKEIIDTLPKISQHTLEMALEDEKAVTIESLMRIHRSAKDNNGQNFNQEPRQDEAMLAERIKLEEIRLRLSLSAASQMAKAGVAIDGMELQQAIDRLKQLEDANNAAALKTVGAEASLENIEAMSRRASIIKSLNSTEESVVGAVFKREIRFTAQEIHNANIQAKNQIAIEGYQANETTVNAKFGDGFGKVVGQIETLLASLGIETTDDNQKAARSLVRTKTDITKENIEAVKAINNKIGYVSQNLHPLVGAEMIKDGFNPLTSHIDQVIEYINKFNSVYGQPPLATMEQAIFNMDKNKELTKEERESVVAMYRMLSIINKNETSASAVIAKSGRSLTMENLMEAAKYHTKAKTGKAVVDALADDSKREVVFTPGSIREQLKSAYQASVNTLEQAGVTEAEAIETLESNNMGATGLNMDLLTAFAENEMDNKELAYASNIRDEIDKVFQSVKDRDALEFFKSVDVEDLKKTEVYKLFDSMKEFFEKASLGEARRNMSESAAFNVFKQDLQSLKNVSPQQIAWLQALNLPLTIGNIKTASAMAKDDGYLGKKLNQLEEIAKDVAGEDLADADIVSSNILEELSRGKSFSEVMEEINNKIAIVKDKALESESPQKAALKEQSDIIRNASIIAEKSAEKERRFQIPLKLHNKIASLNVYMLNEDFDENNMTAFFKLEFEKLGNVEGSVNLKDGFADIIIEAENKSATAYLEANVDVLHKYVADLGHFDYEICFGIGETKHSPRKAETPEEATVQQPADDDNQWMDIRL